MGGKKKEGRGRQGNKSWGDGEGRVEKGGRGRERERETWEDIQINTCVCQVVFFWCLVFSPSPCTILSLCLSCRTHTDTHTHTHTHTHTRAPAVNPAASRHFRLFSPAQSPFSFSCPGHFAIFVQSLFIRHSAKGRILHCRFMHFFFFFEFAQPDAN